MTRVLLLGPAFATALALAVCTSAPSAAQRPAKPSVPPAPARDSAVGVPPQVSTPSPSTVRPSPAKAASRLPTAAAVLPMTPASPSPETVRPGAAVTSVAAPAEVRKQLVPFVPPAPEVSAVRALDTRVTNAERDPAPPGGATGRCKDGGYVSGASVQQQCENRGGAAVLFQEARKTPRVKP